MIQDAFKTVRLPIEEAEVLDRLSPGYLRGERNLSNRVCWAVGELARLIEEAKKIDVSSN